VRHVDCVQGSREWFAARLGIPTASEFDRLLTPKTLKPSAQREAYLHRKLAEWATGQIVEVETRVYALDRGLELEAEALEFYELTTQEVTVAAGFCTTDDGTAGASPDRFAGADGLLELKCPLASTQIGYLLAGTVPTDYTLQLQGQLWVTGKRWVDFLSYYPGLPPLLVRVEPDRTVADALAEAVALFTLRLEEGKRRIEELRGGEA
jgi:hypothetical protein